MNIEKVVKQLRSHRSELATELDHLDQAIAILSNGAEGRHPVTVRHRHMSLAARRRIGAGVRRARRERLKKNGSK